MAKKILVMILLAPLVLTAGCWSKRELNQLAIVLGTGVDVGEKGNVRVTVQIAKPSQIGTQGGGPGGGGQGGGNGPVIVLTNQGKTAFDAFRKIIEINSRKLFFSHNQALIFSEELAKKGLQRVIDFFERDPEMRTEVPLLISRGDTLAVLNIPGNFEKASATEIHNELQRAQKTGINLNVQLHDFLMKLHGGITAPVAPLIEPTMVNGVETFKISGLAVFDGDRLAGTLNDREARGLMWVLGEIENTILVVTPSKSPKGKISLEVTRTEKEIRAKFKEEKPVIFIEVREEANIGEAPLGYDVIEPEIIKELEKKQAEETTKEIKAALKKAQKLKCDIFGFGEMIKRTSPKEWTKISPRWKEIFAGIEIKVSVRAEIIHSGEKTETTALD